MKSPPNPFLSIPTMPFGPTTSNNTNAGSSFESFLQGWLVRQEHYLDELLCAQQSCHEPARQDDLKDLIERVLSHYLEYYEEKSRATNRNVFPVFSPTWFTPFERAFIWIAGFKPGLAFQLVASSVHDLTEDQNRRMDRLMKETKAAERKLAEELAEIQESVAAPPVLEMARREGKGLRNGEIRETDVVIGALRSSMESVLGRADWLRKTTAERVVELLNPVQNVEFLAAAAQLHLRIRMRGLEQEAKRNIQPHRRLRLVTVAGLKLAIPVISLPVTNVLMS